MRSAEHHAGPVRDECLRRRKPKTAAAAGHEVNPAAQAKIHLAIVPGRGRGAQRWVGRSQALVPIVTMTRSTYGLLGREGPGQGHQGRHADKTGCPETGGDPRFQASLRGYGGGYVG